MNMWLSEMSTNWTRSDARSGKGDVRLLLAALTEIRDGKQSPLQLELIKRLFCILIRERRGRHGSEPVKSFPFKSSRVRSVRFAKTRE